MSDQPTPGWYADPTRRFDHRYWDGGTWTEHVSRNGEATTDPLDGSAPAGDTEVIPATTPSEEATGGAAPSWEATGGAAPSWQSGAATRTNAKAVVSLILSIIWFGGLSSIPAIILGVMAKREIRERPDEGGAGLATAGIVIGIIGVIGAVLILLALLSFVAFGTGEQVIVGLG